MNTDGTTNVTNSDHDVEPGVQFRELVDISEGIKAKKISPVDITREMLRRINQENDRLRAYLSVSADSALAAAETAEREISEGRWRGPLHGVPFALKDLFHLSDGPTTFGSPGFATYRGGADATVITRLREAGAVIVGLTHMHEGAFADHHSDIGHCISPWNAACWPGGSSSGSAVALAAGLAYGALGTDTGGSIRFPCAGSGVTGVKVTWGRVSRHGVLPLSESLDTVGPMARSARDCAAILDAIAGPDPLDPTSSDTPVPRYLEEVERVHDAKGLRIGVDVDHFTSGVHGEVAEAIAEAVEVLRSVGAVIVPVKVPDRREAIRSALIITEAECAMFHQGLMGRNQALYGEALLGAIERGMTYPSTTVARAYGEKSRFTGTLNRFLSDLDGFVAPIYPQAALRYDYFKEDLADLDAFVGYTSPYNLTGHPAVAFPVGFSSMGMPIGMQIVGKHFDELTLLKAADAYQRATAWHDKHPPAH